MASKKEYQSADSGQIKEYMGTDHKIHYNTTPMDNPPSTAKTTESQSHGHKRNS